MPPITDRPAFDIRAEAKDVQRNKDERFMRLAMKLARVGLQTPVPVKWAA
jgi:hypothetical protein